MSKRKVLTMTTDEEAEAFLAQDLTDLDYRTFEPLGWETKKKTTRVTLRLPASLIAAVKARAAERGVPFQRLIREAIERAARR